MHAASERYGFAVQRAISLRDKRSTLIRLQNVYKDYGGRPALINANLHIGVGEFAFLVGPSGAGKSTMMRLLYREETPTRGAVMIGGVNLTKLHAGQIPLLRRRLGIVFQDYKLLPRQTVFDNVAYILRALGLDEQNVQKRAASALGVVGLLDKITAYPDELSGGEQQRVGIARAIVNGPPVLLAERTDRQLGSDNVPGNRAATGAD